MSTKPTQSPRAHRLSVDVLTLHDLWRARDPREHVDERGSYWLAVRWSPFAVPVPPILPAALPADARALTIRAAPVLHTGAEPSAAYRVEPAACMARRWLHRPDLATWWLHGFRKAKRQPRRAGVSA